MSWLATRGFIKKVAEEEMNMELCSDFYKLDDIAYGFTQKTPFQGSIAVATKRDGEIDLTQDMNMLPNKKLSKIRHLLRYKFISLMSYGKMVLDYGCGCGYGTLILSKNAKEVCGIDGDPAAINFARKYNQAENIKYSMVLSKLTKFKNDFDLLVAVEILEHMPPKEVNTFISSLKDAVTRDGLIVLTTPIIDRTVNHYVEMVRQHMDSGESSFHNHYKEYDKKDFIKALTRNGLQVEQYLLQKYDGSIVYQIPKDTRFGKQLNLETWVQIAVCKKEA